MARKKPNELEQAVEPKTEAEMSPQEQTTSVPTVTKLKASHRIRTTLHAGWRNPKIRYSTLLGAIILVAIIFIIPTTRYQVLGLALQKQVTVMVVDSKTGTAISGAAVTVDGNTITTESNGKAVTKAHLGRRLVTVSKQYYQSASTTNVVVLTSNGNSFKVTLAALGRQVPIKVTNKVTGKPLAGALITIGGSQTKTDMNGLATVIAPPSVQVQTASLSYDGFNKSSVMVTVGDSLTAANTFSLSPAGKIYFLSNLSGKIDVIKTNLDGTDRQTVLAGTGNEDQYTTSLLASRNWKYLALLSKRTAKAEASVYLIDTTSSDKLTTIDEGNALFSLVGWSDNRIVYQVNRTGVESWQPNAQALKSYDATTAKGVILDQTTGEGTSQYDYAKTNFSPVYILDNELVYSKYWSASDYSSYLNGKMVSIISSKVDRAEQTIVKDFPVPNGSNYYSVDLNLYEPYGVYIRQSVRNGAAFSYFVYENGKVAAKTDLSDAQYNNLAYTTYLESPSSNATFWSESRDGKNALFVGDKNAQNQKQIAALSDYNTYGWYSDSYLLVTKNSSELYIMPRDGSTAPIKLTGYYKPATNYNGYGGGYGGL